MLRRAVYAVAGVLAVLVASSWPLGGWWVTRQLDPPG